MYIFRILSDCAERQPQVEGAFDDKLSVQLWDMSIKLLNMDIADIHEKLRTVVTRRY